MSSIELSVIVPTFKEVDNVELLLDALDAALPGITFETIFVDDDSPDGTAARVKQLAQSRQHVRCLHRIGRRGLSSAAVEGILSSSAPFVAVIDGDMQHDERILPQMLDLLRRDQADVVVGSRYADGGSLGDWTKSRAVMSDIAGRLSRTILTGRDLKDPMSGYFMTRRPLFDQAVPHLSIEGFKILLDFIASADARLRVAECPYQFRNRVHGESKLDSLVLWEYGILLLDKLVGHIVPPRFILFAFVGASGVAVHFALLSAMLSAGVAFLTAQSVATLAAMTTNYLLNDSLTYRDKRHRGLQWFKGLASFYLVCGLGALANVGIASALFRDDYTWWISAGAGVIVGTIFNYALTSLFTWRK
jgi:dolichol-phosphate mannosyltransferase